MADAAFAYFFFDLRNSKSRRTREHYNGEQLPRAWATAGCLYDILELVQANTQNI